MRKVIIIVLLCVIVSTTFTSCYDAREVDEWVYVYMIGIDKGVSNVLRFTFQIATMKDVSISQQTAGYTSIGVDAPTFYAAVNMLESTFSRRLNYTHAKYIIISEDLAKEGVERFVNGIIRSAQIRRIMNIVVSKGEASEFVNQYDISLTDVVGKASEAFVTQNELNGFFVDVTYHEFFVDLKSLQRSPVATLSALNDFSRYLPNGEPPEAFKSEGDYYAGELPRSGGNAVELLGTALFDGDKMVGALNGDESRVLLMLRDEFKGASISMVDPKDDKLRITLRTKIKKKASIKVDVSETIPVIKVKIFLEADIQNLQSTTPYESEPMISVLENAFKQYIKDILDETIAKCQDLHVDPMGFGHEAVKQFLTIQEWEAYDWKKIFNTAKITSEVEVTIRRTGTLIKTEPTLSSEGE